MWKLGHYSCVQQRSAQHPCQWRKREVVLLEELPSSLSHRVQLEFRLGRQGRACQEQRRRPKPSSGAKKAARASKRKSGVIFPSLGQQVPESLHGTTCGPCHMHSPPAKMLNTRRTSTVTFCRITMASVGF